MRRNLMSGLVWPGLANTGTERLFSVSCVYLPVIERNLPRLRFETSADYRGSAHVVIRSFAMVQRGKSSERGQLNQ